MERTRPPPLGPEESQQVLRRAAELDRQHARPTPLPDDPRIEPGELERIAAESGLSEESVRRALVELSGGAIERKDAPCTAKQVFEVPPAGVAARLNEAMLRNGLSPIRDVPHGTQWLPAPGIGASLSRVLDLGGKGAFLGAAVESSVYAVAGGRTSAELRGHVRDIGLPIATVTGLALALPAVIALLLFLAAGLMQGAPLQHGAAMLIVAALWVALTWSITRGLEKGRTRKLQRALERTLRGLSG